MTVTFTPAERDLIRREFGAGWGEPRPLSAGIWLRRWASGPRKGAPKLSKTVQAMLDYGLSQSMTPGIGRSPGLPRPGWRRCGRWRPMSGSSTRRGLDI